MLCSARYEGKRSSTGDVLRAILFFFLCFVLFSPCVLQAEDANSAQKRKSKKIEVKIDRYFDIDMSDSPATKKLVDMMGRDPNLEITKWTGLSLPGVMTAPLTMSIAGQTAPDIFMSHFHRIENDINQGFLYPLNEWIGEDKNGNGIIDDEEAKWEGWKRVPPLWRVVSTHDGKIYGLPDPYPQYMVIIMRVDLVRAAGLDPNHPPKNWDEFYYWCQKLTDPYKDVGNERSGVSGQRGFYLDPAAFKWLPWMQSAGGSPIVQIRKSPVSGVNYEFGPEATDFHTVDGEDLSSVDPVWKANFSAPEGIRAMEFYHKLRWGKWLRDPATHEPVNLTEQDIESGSVSSHGRKLHFKKEDVITGVIRWTNETRGGASQGLLGSGQVAMQLSWASEILNAGSVHGIDPSLLSWMPIPAAPGKNGQRVVQKQNHYVVMCEAVGRRPKVERDEVWKVMQAICDPSISALQVKENVLNGLAKFEDPDKLETLGLKEYIADIPPVIRQHYEDIRSGKIAAYVEPYTGFWLVMDYQVAKEVTTILMSAAGENFDYKEALKKVEGDANSGKMYGISREVLETYRPVARVVTAVLVSIILVLLFFFVRSFIAQVSKPTTSVVAKWVPWALLAPALVLTALWGYYPLLRGMVMAVQDYHITGNSPFVGLDNFIALALDVGWWKSLGRTFVFVVLNMMLAFCAPIVLALMLSEVPRFKTLFRTLFFLPQITSGIVIILLWRLMYEPTPDGFLNQLLGLLNTIPGVNIPYQTWLQDPRLAMLCCVVPTAWAGMGISSLIYLAVLKGVPEETYEAAEIDGAGIWNKLKHITLPTLMPLIVINFVGAFIGTFQSMGNIFLLTFGGPGEATMVSSLMIWIEAYNNLRFSMATSMAWMLGAMLIGFTYVQIQILRKVEFRKADWN